MSKQQKIKPGEYWLAVSGEKFSLTPYHLKPGGVILCPGEISKTDIYKITVHDEGAI